MTQSDPNNFKARLTDVAERIETELSDRLPTPSGHQSIVMEAMRYAALGGGKRLRPFLVIETAKLFECETEAVWATASALECLHVYSLVHDDLPCMDDDDLRRGKPTVHKAYDEAIAVLAGDGLLTQAFEIIATCNADAPVKVELLALLAKASGTQGMIGGQVIDITVPEGNRDEALITNLQALKTGALIEYAVVAGAILGGANANERDALQEYAKDIGLAFQIKDDILDVESDVETLGKAVGKDENLGKATFVSILGLKGAKEKAVELAGRAKSHLDPFGQKAQILKATVDFVINRQN